MRKKKIFLIASEFAPGMIPFAATVINALADSNRFDVTCLCVNSGKRTYLPYIKSCANPVFIEYPKQKWKKLIYKFWPIALIETIKKIVAKKNPDVIHFLTGDFSLRFFIRSLDKEKVCYTVHDMFPHELPNVSIISPIKRKVINGGYKACRDCVHYLTTSSKYQLDLLKKEYPQKNVAFTNFPSLVTNGIVNGNSCPEEIKNENSYILFFGNVVDYKGVDLLVTAFEKIEELIGLKLVIAGCGVSCPTRSPNVIRINRFIDDSEVRCLFEKAKIVVYPYRSATMSGVLSLAFFFKKKILLSDVPFFLENATSSTTFFETGDAFSLEQKLLQCLKDENCCVDDAYEMIYSDESLVQSYETFYGQICN